ncbi:MAG: ClpP family protease [Sedimentisphaeraceae bacterium JB056]
MRTWINRTILTTIAASMLFACGCSVNFSSRGSAYQLSDFNVGRENFDPESPELSQRIILLDGGINIESANTVCKQIIFLNNISKDKPITLWLNSTGGDMTTYLQIANTIKSTPAPVNVVNTGLCASAAIGLMLNATGARYGFADSYFFIHSCSGGDDELREKCEEHIEKLLKEKTNIPEDWLPLGDAEYTITSGEALKYSIIDEVIESYDIFDEPDAQETTTEQL